jgi:hypothetical protein
MNPKTNFIRQFIVEPVEDLDTFNVWCERQKEKEDGSTMVWKDLALQGVNVDELCGFFYGIEYAEDEDITTETVRQLRKEIYNKAELRV